MTLGTLESGRCDLVAAELDTRTGRLLQAGGVILGALFVAFAVHAATGFGGSATDGFFSNWVYDALMLGAAGSCLLRARSVPAERSA